MEGGTRRLVFIDSCAVNRFAGLNLDPTRALAGTEYALAATPDLQGEYRRALAHPYVEPHIKRLLKLLLGAIRSVEPPDSERWKGTDCELAALSRTQIVITVDAKPPWDRALGNPGLIVWPQLEARLRGGESLLAVLRSRDGLASREAASASAPEAP